ncbi:MAG: hypothetical protein ACE5EA_02875 [Nitrospirota bacterium]
MSNKDFESMSMWEYLSMGIIKEWPALQSSEDNVYFQLAGEPIPAIWKDGEDYEGWRVANTVPANLGGIYVQSSDRVARAYKNYIFSITPSDFEKNQQYQQYQIELADLLNDYNTLSTQAHNAYETFKSRYPDIAKDLTYEQWLGKEGTEGLSWYAKLQNNEGRQKVINAEIQDFMDSVNKPLSNAQGAVNNKDNYQRFNFGGASQLELLTTIDELSSFKTEWDNRPEGHYDLDITISKETVETGDWNRVVHKKITKKCASISTRTDIDFTRVIQDTKFKIQVQAVGANTFGINRGDWYQSSWLKATNVKFSEGSRFTMANFFGTKGSLHMVPVRAFVIYKPKVTITINTQTYTEHVKDWHDASAKFTIFGAEFSLAGGENKFVKDGPENTKVITLDSYSEVGAKPLLFGMSSQSFYRES